MRIEINCQECGKEQLEITDFEFDGYNVKINSLPKCQQSIDKEALFEDWYKNIYPKAKGRYFDKGGAKKKFKTRIKSKREYDKLVKGTLIYKEEQKPKDFKFVKEPRKFLDTKDYIYAIEREEERANKKDFSLDKNDSLGYNDVYVTKNGEGKYICDDCGEACNAYTPIDNKQICWNCSEKRKGGENR